MAVAGDVLVELHVHDPVLLQRMEHAGFLVARLDEAQRLGNRHLEHQDLPGAQRRFRNPVAGLDQRGFGGLLGGGDALADAGEEATDAHRVGGVVGALVDHLEHVVRAQQAGGQLHAAGAPAVGHGHLAAAEGHLVAGDGHGLEQRAADHAFALLVEVGEVVVGHGCSGADSRLAWNSWRRRRSRSSSAWKST
ncbi:hypothetical protein D3C81_1457920 [compost metagenome]